MIKILAIFLLILSTSAYAGDTTSLQGAWLFEETSGTRTDETANGNDLTANGTGGIGTGTGKFGVYAADLERSESDYFDISDASQTGLDADSADISIGCWIKAESDPGGRQDIAGKGGKTGLGYNMHVNIGTVEEIGFESNNAGRINCSSCDTLSTGTWYHAAVVLDDSANEVTFYSNGNANTQTYAGSISDSTDPFEIGRNQDDPSYWDGLVDDCFVFTRELTSAEITDIKDNGLASFIGGSDRRIFIT